ncbi:MAG: YbjN domain-containing protein [Cupriavidus sp.]|nr:YbjN domain-containing protein [Cupriavidus sp.]
MKTFNEHEINLATLEAHIRDSGLVPYKVDPDGIWLRTERGIGFRIAIIEVRKFVQLITYLPLRRDASLEDKRELARLLNEGVFLPTFTIDQDGDLAITYAMNYTAGLVAGNLIAIVHRFGSMLEYVVEAFNADGLIQFGAAAPVPAAADTECRPASSRLVH